jgi:hypothetical protein
MRIGWRAACSALLLGLMAEPSQGQLKGENLLVSMPPGFKLGAQGTRDGVNQQQWVPGVESVGNWSEMVTVQIFPNRLDLDPVTMLRRIEEGWRPTCRAATPAAPQADKVNAYPAATLMLSCPRLASTGKPETTMFRAIKGNDSFYLVQRALRAVPAPAQLESMKQYMATVSVCDVRPASHPCPGGWRGN